MAKHPTLLDGQGVSFEEYHLWLPSQLREGRTGIQMKEAPKVKRQILDSWPLIIYEFDDDQGGGVCIWYDGSHPVKDRFLLLEHDEWSKIVEKIKAS